MTSALVTTALVSVWTILAADGAAQADTLEERLQVINAQEATHWDVYPDAIRRTEKATLIDKPVYLWTNPTKNGVQYGSVFIWTHAGRPALVGSLFAHPFMGRRRLVHEFHLLTPTPLAAHCNDEQASTWEPKAGLNRLPLKGADPPAATTSKRLNQMRLLGREFGGHTVDWRKQRWELRLLTRPLYRYELPADNGGDLVDGALLALVTDAGTDPEVLLLLEAQQDGWQYALLRFSDSSLSVTHRGKDVWTAIRGTEEQQNHNANHTYRVFNKSLIDEPVDQPAEANSP